MHSLADRRAITAVSVMVHPEAELAEASRLRGRVATGLHLTLVGERPLLADRLAPLLDADGFLPMRYWGLALRLARKPGMLAATADEIAAQIARYRALWLPLDFVNSHQHTHLLPPIWTTILQVLGTNGAVPVIRTAHRTPLGGLYQTLLGTSSRLAWMFRPLPGRVTLEAIGMGFAGRSTLRDIDQALHRLTRARSRRTLALPELVMHPALERDAAAARHLAWGIQWRREYDLLLSSEFRDLLRAHHASMLPANAIGTCAGPP